MVDVPEAGKIVVGEGHAAPLEFPDGRADILDTEADRGVLGLRSLGSWEERDLGPAAAVDDPPLRALAIRRQRQLLLVEPARPRHVADGKHHRYRAARQVHVHLQREGISEIPPGPAHRASGCAPAPRDSASDNI